MLKKMPCMILLLLIFPIFVHSQTKLYAAVPAEVETFVKKRDNCEHWLGEEPYDEERGKFLTQKVKEDCTGVDAELERLRVKYKTDPKIIDRLKLYEKVE